ncbi:MAG: class I SAM-dependent methyltransferase [Gammaproteobacteria bacterium]
MSDSTCPLCLYNDISLFHRDKKRDYFRCRRCLLVFVPPRQHLDTKAEKAVYDLHENQLDDPGYRRFLSRLAIPLIKRLPAGASGLDYGCGPGPLLARMLQTQGHRIELYDPFYANDVERLQRRYDFIACTEAAEHFRQPFQEFQRLFCMLKPGGLLGIMTKLVIDAEAFSRWHYKNDMTHISFYSRPTLLWLGDRYRCEVEIIGKDVIIFQNRFS